MKMSLLDMTQDILSDMSSDEVNSIDDTVESSQVAQIIKSTYFSLIDERDWPHTKKLTNVQASGDDTLPTWMTLSDSIKKIVSINYDKAKLSDGTRMMYDTVRYLYPDDFLRMCNGRDNTSTNAQVLVDPYSGVKLVILNNSAPTYYTSFDDVHLIFDSYDNEVDTTLQSSKIQVLAYVIPSWTHDDTFIPDLPDHAFTLLLEEAKSRAALKIAQQPDQKAEQESERQRKSLARRDRRVGQGIRFPNYGRNVTPRRDPTFTQDSK